LFAFLTLKIEAVLHAASRKGTGANPDEVNLIFSIYLILQAALGPGVYSASNRKYQKNFPEGEALPARKADNLTAVCEPTV
jgi:hypothetical protein